jgi:hypothetical protein
LTDISAPGSKAGFYKLRKDAWTQFGGGVYRVELGRLDATGWPDEHVVVGWAELAGDPELIVMPEPRHAEFAGHHRDVDIERFERLVSVWEEETMFSSSTTEIAMHWAYQQIIGMGPAILPLILRYFAGHGGHWHWALVALTGENPAAGTASPQEAADAWVKWGKAEGLLDDERDSERLG